MSCMSWCTKMHLWTITTALVRGWLMRTKTTTLALCSHIMWHRFMNCDCLLDVDTLYYYFRLITSTLCGRLVHLYWDLFLFGICFFLGSHYAFVLPDNFCSRELIMNTLGASAHAPKLSTLLFVGAHVCWLVTISLLATYSLVHVTWGWTISYWSPL